MPTYLSPGVYVEEVESGATPPRRRGYGGGRLRRARRERALQHADPGEQLDRVRRDVRRVPAGVLPRPVRLRLLHERRRQLLRRPHRAERLRARARAPRSSPPGRTPSSAGPKFAAIDAARPARRDHRGDHRRRRRLAHGRHVQGRREAATASRSRSSTASRSRRGKTNVATVVNAAVDADPGRGGHRRQRWRGSGPARSPSPSRPPPPFPAPSALHGRLRRRRRRPHRVRRPGDGRRDHDAVRARPDERLPAGRDRPREPCRRSSWP